MSTKISAFSSLWQNHAYWSIHSHYFSTILLRTCWQKSKHHYILLQWKVNLRLFSLFHVPVSTSTSIKQKRKTWNCNCSTRFLQPKPLEDHQGRYHRPRQLLLLVTTATENTFAEFTPGTSLTEQVLHLLTTLRNLVYFFVVVLKYSELKRLKKGCLPTLAHSSISKKVRVAGAWSSWSHCIHNEKRRDDASCFSTYAVQDPSHGMAPPVLEWTVSLLISMQLRFSHRCAQRPISQVILDSVNCELTVTSTGSYSYSN